MFHRLVSQPDSDSLLEGFHSQSTEICRFHVAGDHRRGTLRSAGPPSLMPRTGPGSPVFRWTADHPGKDKYPRQLLPKERLLPGCIRRGAGPRGPETCSAGAGPVVTEQTNLATGSIGPDAGLFRLVRFRRPVLPHPGGSASLQGENRHAEEDCEPQCGEAHHHGDGRGQGEPQPR